MIASRLYKSARAPLATNDLDGERGRRGRVGEVVVARDLLVADPAVYPAVAPVAVEPPVVVAPVTGPIHGVSRRR